MTAKLVDDDAIYNYLDITPEEDPGGEVLGIRDAAEELLENETNASYGPEQIFVQDPYDMPQRSHLLYVRRPMKSLEKIEFRYLPEIVQELYFNLDITQYVTFAVGKRRIYSHVYPFPQGYDNILISYTAAANQPKLAVLAIKDVVSTIWNIKGNEDVKGFQKGSYQAQLLNSVDDSRAWKKAVENLYIPTLG